MNVMIISSSNEKIDDYYKSIARSVSGYLSKCCFDLVFGASSNSMMGICYEEFIKQNRNIYAFTTEKYLDDLKNLPNSYFSINETTFDMKKAMFENSDLIVALPGGIGTVSEILSFIEENRSNNKDVPIVVYDEDNYYQKLFDMFKDMSDKNFITEDIEKYICITHNVDEFRYAIDNYIFKGKVK